MASWTLVLYLYELCPSSRSSAREHVVSSSSYVVAVLSPGQACLILSTLSYLDIDSLSLTMNTFESDSSPIYGISCS